jgi:arylsulfatase A-like enzyme
MQKIYKFSKLLILLLLIVFSGCTRQNTTENHPNIIVFFVDDLGYNDLGFRNKDYYTPNIDRLKKESLTFKNAYVPSPTCSPSRVGLLTGQHPARLRFFRHCGSPDEEFNVQEKDSSLLLSRNWLPLEVTTYAEVLKRADYNTFFAGKWHLGGEEFGPEKQGFDRAVTKAHHGHANNYYPPYYNDEKPFKKDIPKDKYLTEFFTDTVVGYIQNYNNKRPFLIQFSYQNVHSPNIGDRDFIDLYKKRGFKGALVEYGAQISAVDKSVGRVLKALKEKGFDKNTIVIFTSDQGSAFPNTPLRGGKKRGTALYEGAAKVPFIIKWPGVTTPDSENSTHIQTIDVFPTFAEIVKQEISEYKDIDGLSLVDVIKNDKPLKRNELYGFRTYDAQYASVLTSDNWKLVAYLNGNHELYKVDEDISEKNDLAGQNPQKLQELLKKLEQWKKKVGVEIKSK